MRLEDAAYGGEMSAHHYFRDFAYCDTGMVPWLLVAEIMSHSGKPLSQLVEERMRLFPARFALEHQRHRHNAWRNAHPEQNGPRLH